MPFRKSISIVFVLLLLVAVSTIVLWELDLVPLRAQGDGENSGEVELFLPFIVAGGSAGDGEDQSSLPPSESGSGGDGHTGHSHQVPLLDSWPPQPVGIEQVTWLAANPSSGIVAAQLLKDEAEVIASASPLVQAALGENYVHSSTIYDRSKAPSSAAGKGESAIQVAYFSYTKNATVDVTVTGGKVHSLQTMDASSYQPEPTRQERIRAIEIARSYFQAQNETRVNQLHGFVIMAYRNQGATGFYDSRVLYVTFHESLEERPEYLAWVDLRAESVIEGRIEQYDETAPAIAPANSAQQQQNSERVGEGK